MKKTLLAIMAVGIGLSASAADRGKAAGLKSVRHNDNFVANEALSTNSTHATARGGQQGNTTAGTYQMGIMGNAYGTYNGGRCFLWYEPSLDILVQVHRSDLSLDPTTGHIRFDISTDRGLTWNANVGPIYTDPTNVARARYPQGGLWNPTGNTDPANARVVYYAPLTDGAGWFANAHGAVNLDGTNANQSVDNYVPGTFDGDVADEMHIVKNTGDVWVFNRGFDQANIVYLDKVYAIHGVWDATLGHHVYTPHEIPSPLVDGNFIDGKLAFSDDGQTGYVTVMGNRCRQVPGVPNNATDSTIYFIVHKTTDGGTTWNTIGSVYVQGADTLLQNGETLSSGFNHDLAVDNAGNLHICTQIGIAALAADGSFGSIINQAGFYGVFDIYTTDGGGSWACKLLGKPLSFRGTFGTAPNDISEDIRPTASRNYAGDKLFFSWFETDTLTWGTTDNLFPDMHYRGLDLTTGLWSAELTTEGGSADGAMTIANASYYVIDDGAGNYTIPASYSIFQAAGDPVSPVDLWYVDEAVVNSFTETLEAAPLAFDNCLNLTSVTNIANDGFQVSSNYPNPFNGITKFDLTLVNADEVTISITDVTGKLVATQSYGKIAAGSNTVEFNAAGVSAGLYVYTVTVGQKAVTGKLTIQ
ncbi:MAG: hypothetical protein RIQ89_2093 [Bacteroidota bacterium]|jgi:hypothetical protein